MQTDVFVHLSDLHFRKNWEEEVGLVLNAFLHDIEKQIVRLSNCTPYLIFSGDIVQAGSDADAYSELIDKLDVRLNSIGIPKAHRFCIPGNHDVAQSAVSADAYAHDGVVANLQTEALFNDYFSLDRSAFLQKFQNYDKFAGDFAIHGAFGSNILGASWCVDSDIAIYGLNTALLSSGGAKDATGKSLVDKERLGVYTRALYKWLSECTSKHKIMVMHHPISALSQWAQTELRSIFKSHFNLVLNGHTHEQELYHEIQSARSIVTCTAPPLFTRKSGDLGYGMIHLCPVGGLLEIRYRSWTKYHSFVIGSSLSNTDDGVVRFVEKAVEPNSPSKPVIDVVASYLQNKLTEALAFSSLPISFVEPIIMPQPEFKNRQPDEEEPVQVVIDEFLKQTPSTFIMAPPEYGLTCLAHYLALRSWQLNLGLWLYVDLFGLKLYKIDKAIQEELDRSESNWAAVTCILLDSWDDNDKHHADILEKLCDEHPTIPVIVMRTLRSQWLFSQGLSFNTEREFQGLFLWALSRGLVRKFVSVYNSARPLGDEDSILSRVVADLEAMNIPRTPLNCVQIIAASERQFEESPVNRTEVMNNVLRLLFDLDIVATYQSHPDVKDCEFVLGSLCGKMIQTDNYEFSDDQFFSDINAICQARYMELDVEALFQILVDNKLLMKTGKLYRFKYRVWLLYFAAHCMKHDKDFCAYILTNMRYADCPEILEFYTGIDRDKSDALGVLVKDISTTCDTVDRKLGIDRDNDPFGLLRWKSTPAQIERMKEVVSEEVLSSKLPDVVKDEYADNTYDRAKPHNQDIRRMAVDYSLDRLVGSVKAGSRALRNSDYADPHIKKRLLELVMRSWEQMAMVLFYIAPVLTRERQAEFEGASFQLAKGFATDERERFIQVLSAIPLNVVNMFEQDLSSVKMGPLILHQLKSEERPVRMHHLNLLLIRLRPQGWRAQIEKYIASIAENSFYLRDTAAALEMQYRYSYADDKGLRDIKYVFKMALAKHDTGKKAPGITAIKKISNERLPENTPSKTAD